MRILVQIPIGTMQLDATKALAFLRSAPEGKLMAHVCPSDDPPPKNRSLGFILLSQGSSYGDSSPDLSTCRCPRAIALTGSWRKGGQCPQLWWKLSSPVGVRSVL